MPKELVNPVVASTILASINTCLVGISISVSILRMDSSTEMVSVTNSFRESSWANILPRGERITLPPPLAPVVDVVRDTPYTFGRNCHWLW